MFWLFTWALLNFSAAQDPFERIYTTIINNSSQYNPLSPPWLAVKTPVDVVITDYFTVLISVEENRQVVKYISNLNFTWFDPRLRWDPLEMGTDSISLPSSVPLWRPTFSLYNAVNTKDLDEQWAASPLQVNYQGRVSLTVYSMIETVCPINVEAYPFDDQYCFMGFTSVVDPIEFLNISAIEGVLLTAGIPEWDIRETYAFRSNFTQVGNVYPLAQIAFRFKRNPQFYVFFLILPTFIVTSLCIGAMLLPIELELGERINLGIAGLLGLTFLLSVIIGELPRTPSLPLMGKWVIMEMFFCFFSMMVPIIMGCIDKLLIRLSKKIDIRILEGILFLTVSLSNIITTILLFVFPPKRALPTKYLKI